MQSIVPRRRASWVDFFCRNACFGINSDKSSTMTNEQRVILMKKNVGEKKSVANLFLALFLLLGIAGFVACESEAERGEEAEVTTETESVPEGEAPGEAEVPSSTAGTIQSTPPPGTVTEQTPADERNDVQKAADDVKKGAKEVKETSDDVKEAKKEVESAIDDVKGVFD